MDIADLQRALTSQSGITPELLEQGNDIFLQIPEHKIRQWGGLITLILQQFLNHFECRAEDNDTPILFLLDEFARFGKLEGIVHGLATLRSKKITICILIQSLAQLDATYGQEQRKIIADNCSYKAILRATDAETQRYFSQLVGTEEHEQRNESGKPLLWGKITRIDSVSYSMVERPRIKPEEFAYLEDIVLLTPYGFSRVEKVPYYQMQGRQPLS